ncbi:phage terminase large subunit family protein [Variovorax atrisoli]|uniref:phage terminase large subunit family protein n=1 Tax=Variovorax atrisoli TaxID=3394203 RepID=UPI00119A683E|nr:MULTISPECIES: phage terminase large subunit family protein [Variovorax]MBB3641160.1 phage terminase large subunit GpA-like protein [Variovorax sp. BK613]MDR6522795.1 phage terminase large subunit GpA-like protein [Variovorax paradoxus]
MAAHVSRETFTAVLHAVTLGLGSLRAEVFQTLSEWAADHFKLAGESSHQKGGWIAWSFQVGILDFMSDDRIEELDVMKSKRVGYTKMITAFVAYNIAHRRRKQALWQPTDDDRDSYVKSEIDPILDARDGVPSVQAARRKGGGNDDTIKMKKFRDSVLHLLGGKAKRAYRRITVAISILDEWSAFDQTIEKSGDPGGLAKGRLEGAPYPKFVGGSTPGVKGLCHVERAALNAAGFVRFYIDCKHCGVEHPLSWGGKEKLHGFKWERGNPASVRHVCPHCRKPIRQSDFLQGGLPMPGRWVCEKTGKTFGPDRIWRDATGMPTRPPQSLGLHVWAAYSPQRTWESIVKEFEEACDALARGDAGPMQLFVNETLGETWEVVGERTDEHALQLRAEPYALRTVPAGGLVLTAGVDVQRDRWEIDVWAWGRGLESWHVEHHVIYGNPASEDDWAPVTAYLSSRYVQAWHGGSLGLSAISIDSSDQTQAVYNWVRKTQHLLPKLRAVKGRGEENVPVLGPSSPQEVRFNGKKIPNGIKLWNVGVDTAKDLLLGQLAIEQPGPGFIHFSSELPREWFEQLTAEQRILVKVNGKEVFRWVKRRPRNEVLDNRNYALHAAFGLGLHNYADKRWTDLEASVQPPRDLFSTMPLSPNSSGAALEFEVTSATVAHGPAAALSREDIDIFSPIELN